MILVKVIDQAFILAAGRGTRMAPLTSVMPKPMIQVWGRALIDYILDHCQKAGIRRVIVNVHHKAQVLAEHLCTRQDIEIAISFEEDLLDTGGGIAKTIQSFEGQDFFVINGDALWEGKALAYLRAAWNPQIMDILILLQPIESMILTTGVGDYDLLSSSSLAKQEAIKSGSPFRAMRSLDKMGGYMFTSLRINRAGIFETRGNGGAYSYLELLDKAQSAGRLYGLVHRGVWHHLSTPEDVTKVCAARAKS